MDQNDCDEDGKIRMEFILENLIDEYKCVHKKFFKSVPIMTL